MTSMRWKPGAVQQKGQTDRAFIYHLVLGKLKLKVTDRGVTTRYVYYRSLTPSPMLLEESPK